MAEVKHEIKSVKNQGEVIVDNDRALPRERNPELDQLLEYLSTMGEMMLTEEDQGNWEFLFSINLEQKFCNKLI